MGSLLRRLIMTGLWEARRIEFDGLAAFVASSQKDRDEYHANEVKTKTPHEKSPAPASKLD